MAKVNKQTASLRQDSDDDDDEQSSIVPVIFHTLNVNRLRFKLFWRQQRFAASQS